MRVKNNQKHTQMMKQVVKKSIVQSRHIELAHFYTYFLHVGAGKENLRFIKSLFDCRWLV